MARCTTSACDLHQTSGPGTCSGPNQKEVVAISVNSGTARFAQESTNSTGALLRFDGERVAAAFADELQRLRRRLVSHRGHQGARSCRSRVRIRRGTRVSGDDRWKDDQEADRKARSVRAGTLVFLRLHPKESSARACPAKRAFRMFESCKRSMNPRKPGKVVQIPPFQLSKQPTGRQRIQTAWRLEAFAREGEKPPRGVRA